MDKVSVCQNSRWPEKQWQETRGFVFSARITGGGKVNAPLECVPDLQIPEVAPILLLPNGYHQPPKKPLPPIISGHDLLHQELVFPDELVEGMIHRGTQTLVAGCSKSYKTWILMHLAVCVATGTDFWARKTVQGRILYLNFEIDAAFFQKRLREICRLTTG